MMPMGSPEADRKAVEVTDEIGYTAFPGSAG